jgi:opacity protein-like surface antigen
MKKLQQLILPLVVLILWEHSTAFASGAADKLDYIATLPPSNTAPPPTKVLKKSPPITPRLSGYMPTNHFYVGAILGIDIANIGKNQLDNTFDPLNGSNQYLATGSSHDLAGIYGLNGGYEFSLGEHTLWSFGLGIYQTSEHTSKGEAWNIFPDGTTDHVANYQYSLNAFRVMAETELGWQFNLQKASIIPFISLGIGSASNSAHSYEETAITSVNSLEAGFRSNTKTNFAYQLGAGLNYQFENNQDRLGLAYRYADLGNAEFDSRPAAPYTYKLDVGKIKTHEVYLIYTHLF